MRERISLRHLNYSISCSIKSGVMEPIVAYFSIVRGGGKNIAANALEPKETI